MHASACRAESRDPAHVTGHPGQSLTVLPASLPASTATARSQVLLSGNPVQIASVQRVSQNPLPGAGAAKEPESQSMALSQQQNYTKPS